jgi:hypothetical protein
LRIATGSSRRPLAGSHSLASIIGVDNTHWIRSRHS